MHITTGFQVGRVIRLGRGWVDVFTNQGARRVTLYPGLMVRVGCNLKIINNQGVSVIGVTRYN